MITNQEAQKIRERLRGQDKLIFDTCIETGLRVSDVLNLRFRDLGKVMYVREMKTGKHKAVEVSDELAERLNAMKKNLLNYDLEKYAFKSPRSPAKHLDRSTYHRHLKQACMTAGNDCSAHSTRKLYAMNMYYKNFDIYEVQKALNHKYITTTATYMGLDLAQLIRDAMQHKLQT